MILQEHNTFANEMTIPKLGLGTWFIEDEKAAEAVRSAVAMGYRLIDTAQAYGNEHGVGEGVRTCGVPRESLFVASKVAAELKTYEAAAKYGVSAAQLCIRYVLQLGTIALPKTANPEHMKNNADVDFVITDTDFQTLLQMEELWDYGAYNIFPVFSGKPLA